MRGLILKVNSKRNSQEKTIITEEEPLETTYHKSPENMEPEAQSETHWTDDEILGISEDLDSTLNLVHLYLSETRRTPMLTGAEEKKLGSYIEQDKYLAQTENQLSSKFQRQPTAAEIMFNLLDSFNREGPSIPNSVSAV